jgi:alpha-tubulin suppressor-like RCC1 family protein
MRALIFEGLDARTCALALVLCCACAVDRDLNALDFPCGRGGSCDASALGADGARPRQAPHDADSAPQDASADAGYLDADRGTDGAPALDGSPSDGAEDASVDAASTAPDASPPLCTLSIGTGRSHTCVTRADGSVWCWGLNAHGQLGNGDQTDQSAPVRAIGMPAIAAPSPGGFHTCGLEASGTLVCLGANYSAQLGDGTIGPPLRTATVARAPAASLLSAGDEHTCAVPTPVQGLPIVLEVRGGTRHTCAHDETRTWCWGDNSAGAIGDGTRTGRPTPVALGSVPPIMQLALGNGHSCALVASDGSVLCWGSNGGGQLGDGTTIDRLTPVPVSGLSGAVQLSAGIHHTCALTAQGALYCWGYNANGQVGDGTIVSRSAPVQIFASGVLAVAAGWKHTCARMVGGTIQCWGDNASGELGDGTFTSRLTPGPVSLSCP